MNRVVIVGGGPGGYEAALVAAQLEAEVTVVDRDGLGGSAVLTDCVPSKTLIATAELMTSIEESRELGVESGHAENLDAVASVDLAKINARVKRLAMQQSDDIAHKLDVEGIRVIRGTGRLDGRESVMATTSGGAEEIIPADIVLLATGAQPRVLPTAVPDGERILTWEQVYDLTELPHRLIVVGSGVTGAEFASAYNALGADVVLVSSRDRVLPGEDAQAATVLEDVLTRRGMTVLSKRRANGVTRNGDTVTVSLSDGSTVEGSHCLMAVGSIPNTSGLGLLEAGIRLDEGGSPSSTGCHVRACARSTPPATVPVSSCSPRSPRCRAGSPCGTPSVMRSSRSASSPSQRTCSPRRRSPQWVAHRRPSTVGTSTRAASCSHSPAMRGPRCRVFTMGSSSCSAAKLRGLSSGASWSLRARAS
jgi:pyruvate/2-oxoglutarate dehydrogenase complex dihydrolipoamide dehydrogenase (E3) component